MLLVKKKDDNMRSCFEYHQLNKMTIKNKYPLPRIDHLIDQSIGTCIFNKIYLRSGSFHIQVKDADISKNDFRTRYGHDEYSLMSFIVFNAPGVCLWII